MSTLIESEVPFGHALYSWLYLNSLHLNQVVSHDTRERHFLAWETVRKERNPYFAEGTGFEGYLVGCCGCPEAALETVLNINQHILDAIARLYRYQFGLRSRLMKTLMREDSDRESIQIWSAYLGAELGKLRVHIAQSREAQDFQNQTYNLIRSLPPVTYQAGDKKVTQAYLIGSDNSGARRKLAVASWMLSANQQDAWLVAENIGQFGHPLLRRFLDRG